MSKLRDLIQREMDLDNQIRELQREHGKMQFEIRELMIQQALPKLQPGLYNLFMRNNVAENTIPHPRNPMSEVKAIDEIRTEIELALDKGWQDAYSIENGSATLNSSGNIEVRWWVESHDPAPDIS